MLIELLQIWSFGRYTSVFDVVANAGGAMLGWWLARALSRFWKSPDRLSLNAFTAGAAALVVGWPVYRVDRSGATDES